MHDGYWHGAWMAGPWGWIAMTMVMAAFWGGLIWFAISLIRRTPHAQNVDGANRAQPPDPRDVLADRLARGDIDLDDYRQRLDALDHGHTPL